MRSENLTINAAAGGAAASSRLDIRAAAGITGAYVAYMMGSGFSTGQEIKVVLVIHRQKKDNSHCAQELSTSCE